MVVPSVPCRRACSSTPENFKDVGENEVKEYEVVEGQRFTVFGATGAARGVEVDQIFNHDGGGNDDDRAVDDSILSADGPFA